MKPSAYISSFAVLAVYATLPGPFTNALNLAHSPAPKGSVYRGTVTWYGPGYEGKGMNGPGIYRDSNPSIVAVPVKGKKGKRDLPILPYGTRLRITIPNGKSIEVIVSDTCPGGTWDLSAAGMKALGFKNPNQKIRNARIEVMK